MAKRIIIAILLAANAVIMALTYGHAFVGIEREERARCAVQMPAVYGKMPCRTAPESVLGGLVSAALWPFYWSVQLARGGNG